MGTRMLDLALHPWVACPCTFIELPDALPGDAASLFLHLLPTLCCLSHQLHFALFIFNGFSHCKHGCSEARSFCGLHWYGTLGAVVPPLLSHHCQVKDLRKPAMLLLKEVAPISKTGEGRPYLKPVKCQGGHLSPLCLSTMTFQDFVNVMSTVLNYMYGVHRKWNCAASYPAARKQIWPWQPR